MTLNIDLSCSRLYTCTAKIRAFKFILQHIDSTQPQPQKQTKLVMEGRDIHQDFVSLATAGYAATVSAGIGLRGTIQIGFDTTRKLFVIKAKAKATLGIGAGGAMEFAVSTENIWWFIRFVHAQLNDHNFSFLNFIEPKAYENFTALSWELLKEGKLLESGIVGMGAAAMKSLTTIEKLIDKWDEYNHSDDTADRLANIVNQGQVLLQYMNPEVKGRLIDKLCHSNKWNPFDNDDNKEQAILRVLNTVASKREFTEIKEHMGPPIQERDKTKRQKIKEDQVGRANVKLSDILQNQYKTQFATWEKALPEVAVRIIT